MSVATEAAALKVAAKAPAVKAPVAKAPAAAKTQANPAPAQQTATTKPTAFRTAPASKPVQTGKPAAAENVFRTKPTTPRKPVTSAPKTAPVAKPAPAKPAPAKPAPAPAKSPTPAKPAAPAPASPAPSSPSRVNYRLMGDADGDGVVGAADLKIVHRNNGQTGIWSDGDFTGDGKIDFHDFQVLELNFGKTVPSHYANIGTNLDGVSDYATIGAFTDLARMFRQWGSVEKPYEPDASIPRTADNYPLADAGAMTYARTYPDGVYKVSWDGTADVNFTGMGAEFTITSQDGNHYTADLVLDHKKGEILNLYVTNVDPNDPLHNLRIISPDAEPSISPTFRPVFLDKVRAFNGPIRFMDWMQTNWNPAVEWSDRTRPSTFSNANATGVDYESIIELANLTQKDVWINVPYHASDDYIREMARLFRDTLDPSLTVHVEFSNELWNTGTFQQAIDNLIAGRAMADDPLSNRTDDFGRAAEHAGKQFGRMATLFREEYGADLFADRVRPVFGGFIATTYWTSSAMEYLARAYGPVNQLVSAISVAPYVGVQGDMDSIDDENLTAQKLFDWMHDFIDDRLVPWIRDHKALTNYYGVELHAYEAGQSLQAINGKNEELKTAAQNDPRMGGVYKHLIRAWHDHSGGGIFGNFALATPYTVYGYWGALEAIDQPTSAKWEAILDQMAR
jgi:hypothetical protein